MSADAIRQKLLGRFREVARDRAERLVATLLQMGDAQPGELRDELARELHTLKGEARMMGFSAISQLAHTAEDLLAAGLHGERLSAVRRACEAIPLLLDEPPEGGPGSRSLLADLQALLAGGSSLPSANVALERGAAASGAGEKAQAGGAAAPPVPPEPVAAPPASGPSDRTHPPVEANGQAAHPGAHGPQAAPRDLAAVSIRVDLDALDEIAGLAGDTLVEGARAGARTLELKALLDGWNAVADKLLHLAEQNDRPELRPLAEEIEDEVHRLRTRAFRFFHHHAESVGGVQRLLATLAEKVADARLLPLGQLFADLPRTAAALAREQGREVEVVIEGAETGIDKAILPSLQDPLVHLVRNCIDHGIEPPDVREAKGKPRVGRLLIRARPDGDRLRVILEDDGVGIDPATIREAAVRRGILSEAEAAALSDRAAIDLIFAPGFSTRREAGATSGRGVGLDVVRRRVASLGGAVTVESELGVGTRFILHLPQTLALVKVLLIRLDDDVYGLPAASVESVGRLDPAEVQEVAGVRVVRHRDRLLPVVAAGPLLGLNGGPRGTRPAVAYLHHGDAGLALVVDGFRGEREVAVKAPGAFLQGRRFISGAASLEDGGVALLLSPSELIAAARSRTVLPDAPRQSRKRILLVDDSHIAREAEAALLRALGHQVEEAADGEEGLRKALAGNYDLLVTDVQMPVIDGIELTRRVKAEPTLQRLPVLILSSLETPHDRRRGLEAGADGYLGKAELDGERLSRMVERLCGSSSRA